MEDLVENLRKGGYILWIISNTNELHARHLEHFYSRLFSKFHGKTYSFEEGVRSLKPHPYIYCCTLARLRHFFSQSLKPEECVFIDDMEENIKAAESLGWKGIQHKSIIRTKCILEDYGVRL